MKTSFFYISLLVFSCSFMSMYGQVSDGWPEGTRETKPWSRWWWHGSAVTKDGITAEMEAYQKAGLGGLEITPIYGVHGTEKQFVNYLTPEWMELLIHTLQEAERLDLGIDMATGTGWPFGGPWVSADNACKNLEHKIYTLKGGETLKEKIVFIQQPFVRAVGSQIYEVHDSTITGQQAKGTLKEPLMRKKEEITMKQLVEPIAANKNLQLLALDQVKFEKSLPLQTLMAYSDAGKAIELTDRVDKEGNLQWKAPKGNWKLYAVFAGWHGKMVERAGPGGEGNVIDHFSAQALKNYLDKFDSAFKGHDLTSLRAFFNDSYEVDDARGAADWTPMLFEEFKKRRGYDLKEHLPALFAQDKKEKNERVLCDYRETISALVLENFTRPWKAWAHQKNALVRNQAHGSPSNILDLYATVDIPEIEGVEPLRIKMASSAGNVTGKKLISAESATWLNEHFESNLADIKTAVDRFMLYGVNHILYHGTSYSPPGESWPGWLFYAAVHLNPRNPLWQHFPALNTYIERAQSLLQNAKPNNDVLLYYPIYDRFSTPGDEMIEHFDAIGAQFNHTVFKDAAEMMLAKGYAFDYISDRQIINTKAAGGNLLTEGNSNYKTLMMPHVKYIPLATLRKVMALAAEGTTIIMAGGPPAGISGYNNLQENNKVFADLIQKLPQDGTTHGVTELNIGKGRILIGADAEKLLEHASVRKETLVEHGFQFLRKTTQDSSDIYFISNGEAPFEGWVNLQTRGETGQLFDAMTGEIGIGRTRKSNDVLQVFLKLKSRETIFIKVLNQRSDLPEFPYYNTVGNPLLLKGPWSITFTAGGPELPPAAKMNELVSWTNLAHDRYSSFSGAATYTISFPRPTEKSSQWLLDLGTVKESADVKLNGQPIGILIGPLFQVYFDDALLKDENILEVTVCNLMANRIAYMDQHGIFWKKFYNVNFPARKPENRQEGIFDASKWKPRDAGIIGPVQLWPVGRD